MLTIQGVPQGEGDFAKNDPLLSELVSLNNEIGDYFLTRGIELNGFYQLAVCGKKRKETQNKGKKANLNAQMTKSLCSALIPRSGL